MALPNLTAINIYLANGSLWRTIDVIPDCKYIDELEGDERLELKWESYDYEKIPVGSYINYDSRVFRLTEPHEPSRRTEDIFTYAPIFYTEAYHWRKAMACYYEYSSDVTYTNNNNTISATIPEPTSRELDWSFTGNLPDALFMLLQAIKNETGAVWNAHYDSSVANQLIEITAQGLSVRDMLSQIADQCGKEFYFDYSGATPVVNIGTLEVEASGEHTEDGRVVLNVGEDVSNPSVSSEAEEYFTRFYFFGSTRNIEQPNSVTKSSVVNRRLPLLSSASGDNNYYPKGFIDISGGSYVNHAYTPSLPDYKVFTKSVFFDDIYPHASYKVLSVQKAYIPVKDDANQPTGERMPIYYVALYDSNDANRQAISFNDWVGDKNGVEGQMVPTLVPSIAFRGGYLQGLEYELIYHKAGDKVSTYAADGTKSQLTLTANCFEIVFDTNANPRLPNDNIYPRGYTANTYDGDDCTLFNIKMPASYILNAQLELETKALEYIADLNVDKSTYEMESDADNFEKVTIFKELRLGHKAKLVYPNGDAIINRVIGIERSLDLPCDCHITLGYSAKQGNIKTLREMIADTSDKTETVIKEGEKNKAQILGLRNGYRAQQEALDTYFDPDGSFDGSRIKPETIQTGALAVGAKSQQFTLSGVQMSVAKYSSGNGTLSWVCDSGKLAHFTLDDEYTLIWPMSTGTQALNNANAHYIYAKCAKDGFGAASGGIKTNSNNGTFVATADQIKFDSDNNYYYFLVGTVSSAQTDSDSSFKTRIISMTYGMTTVNGKQITTGVIRSSDSDHGVVINLDTGEIIGKITFRTSQGTDVNAETYIGETAAAAAQSAVDNLEIGGRNLLINSATEWTNAASTTAYKRLDITTTPLVVGGKYQLSFDAKTSNGTDVFYAALAVTNTSRIVVQSIKPTTTYKRMTVEFVNSGDYALQINAVIVSNAVSYARGNGNNTGTLYIKNFKLEEGTKSTDWTPAPEDVDTGISNAQAAAEAAQQSANTANTTISNMDSDSYFSTVEKKSFRPSWKAICGVDNTTTTPTASTSHGGSYEQALKAASGTTVSTSALTTAFGNLRTHLNTYALYTNTNTNWGANGQTTLATYTKAYYNAETAFYDALADYWSEQQAKMAVDNLQIGGRNLLRNSETMKLETNGKAGWRNSGGTLTSVSPVNKPLTSISGAVRCTNNTSSVGQVGIAQDYTDSTERFHFTVGNKYIQSFYFRGHASFYDSVPSNLSDSGCTHTYDEASDTYTLTSTTSGDVNVQTHLGNAFREVNYLYLAGKSVTISLDLTSSNANNKPRLYIYDGTSSTSLVTWDLSQGHNERTITFPTIASGHIVGLILRMHQYNLSGSVAVGDTCKFQNLIIKQAGTYCYGQPIWQSGSYIPQTGVKTMFPTHQWQKLEWGGVLGGTQKSTYSAGYAYLFNAPVGGWFEVCAMKLEEGTKATDWTPAPEDTEAALTALQTDLQNQIDGKIETWSQVDDPSSAWTTTALKDKHVSDLWYYTGVSTNTRTNNKTYKYTKSGSTYSWTEYSAGGGDLFDKIDGKTTIWYGSPTGTYTGVQTGDFLVDSTTNICYKWSGSAWVKVQEVQNGGTNMLLNSSLTENHSKWTVTGSVSHVTEDGRKCCKITGTKGVNNTIGQSLVNKIKIDVANSQIYTISGYAKLVNYSAGTTNPFLCAAYVGGYYDNNGTSTWMNATYICLKINGVDQNISNASSSVHSKFIAQSGQGWFFFELQYKVPHVPTSWSYSIYGRDFTGSFFFYNVKHEKGNHASDWSPAPEDIESEIAVERARLDNIDSDGVFSIAEKEAYRTDFEKIVGVGIPVGQSIPTASELESGSFTRGGTSYDCKKGTYYLHYKMISSTATVTLGALATAYGNLKDFLTTVGLYTNSDYGTEQNPFSRTTLAQKICAYLDSEITIEKYAEHVGNMRGTLNTAASTSGKIINIDKKDGAITQNMAKDMLADPNMRMTVNLTTANTAQNITLTFYYESGSITPTGRSTSSCYLQYMGARDNQNCYYMANMVVELQYDTIDNSRVRFKLVDEENFATLIAFGKAIQGKTTVNGGLVLTETIVAGEGNGQAGMSGERASDNVAFWAGGLIGAAMNFNVPVVIMRDGTAKFGLLRFNNDSISLADSTGQARLNIVNGTVPTPQSADIKRNSSSTTPSSPVWSSLSSSGSLNTPTSGAWAQVFNTGFVQAVSNKHNGMPVHVRGSSSNTFRIQVTVTDPATLYYLQVLIRIGDNNIIQLYKTEGNTLSGEQDFNVGLTDRYAEFYTAANSGSVALIVNANLLYGGITVSVSNLQYWYYHDSSKSVTTLASDGLGVIVDNENHFLTKEITENNAKKLSTEILGNVKIKGSYDMAGVLWAGIINSDGTPQTPVFRNKNVSITKNTKTTGNYTLNLVGVSAAPIVFATVINDNTSTIRGWSANIVGTSSDYSSTKIKIRTFQDNSAADTAFHLVIIGNN